MRKMQQFVGETNALQRHRKRKNIKQHLGIYVRHLCRLQIIFCNSKDDGCKTKHVRDRSQKLFSWNGRESTLIMSGAYSDAIWNQQLY